MKNTVTIKVYNDPGHGWFAVKRQVLKEFGISERISSYSYQKGQTVYLEEDCDARHLLNAYKAAGIVVSFDDKYSKNRSPIRSYESFKHE